MFLPTLDATDPADIGGVLEKLDSAKVVDGGQDALVLAPVAPLVASAGVYVREVRRTGRPHPLRLPRRQACARLPLRFRHRRPLSPP